MSVGCARSAAPGGTTPATVENEERVASLEAESRRRAEEIRELESQLALARARANAPLAETVRIGTEEPVRESDGFVFFEDDGTTWDEPPAEVLEDQSAEEEDDGRPRPVLRLHEAPSFELPSDVEPLPTAPLPAAPTLPARVAAGGAGGGWRPMPAPGPSATLAPPPVVAAPIPAAYPSAPAPTPSVDASVEAYSRALGLLRERRVPEALRAFDTFLADHGNSPRAAAARYWRAEALYVLRRYGEAQAAFDAYLVSHPRGDRAPDALLKLGLCHEHMGDRGAALRTYERLRREYPSSVAARLASREDA